MKQDPQARALPDVRTESASLSDGRCRTVPADAWGKLVYVAAGVLRVRSGARVWIVPPARAAWVPPHAAHEICAHGALEIRTLCVSPRLSALLPTELHGVDPGPLLSAIVEQVTATGGLDGAHARQRRLLGVLLDELRAAARLPWCLEMPSDRRARLVAERLWRNPADPAALGSFAHAAGASTRTLQRLFRDETGLRFSEWRRRLRMLHAAERLGAGETVTAAGKRAGYATSSAFIAAFRKQLGCTPLRFCRTEPRAPRGRHGSLHGPGAHG